MVADNGFETVTRRDAGVEPTRTYSPGVAHDRVEELVVCHRAESSEVSNAARNACIELLNCDLVGLRTSEWLC